ncbi:hypothetical protein D3C81_1636580 [compost metagenome]
MAHRTEEVALGPAADAGLRVGADIGRVDHAKGRLQPVAAREWSAAWRGVASGAVGLGRNVRAAGDGGRVDRKGVGASQLVIGDVVSGTVVAVQHGGGEAGQRQRDAAGQQGLGLHGSSFHACTSGPGFLMYCSMIALAVHKARAPMVTVGL